VFYQLYKQDIGTRIAKRCQALRVLRRGERLKRMKELRDQPQADLAGAQGVEGDRSEGRDIGPCGFSQGKPVGEMELRRVYQPALLS